SYWLGMPLSKVALDRSCSNISLFSPNRRACSTPLFLRPLMLSFCMHSRRTLKGDFPRWWHLHRHFNKRCKVLMFELQTLTFPLCFRTGTGPVERLIPYLAMTLLCRPLRVRSGRQHSQIQAVRYG